MAVSNQQSAVGSSETADNMNSASQEGDAVEDSILTVEDRKPLYESINLESLYNGAKT